MLVDPESRADLIAAAVDAGRFPDAADELIARGAVVPLVHENGMEVDRVLGGSTRDARCVPATRIPLDGVSVPVAHPTDLVVMKVLAGRGKDLVDVRQLIANGEVDLNDARDLLEQLETALGVSDLVRALDAAIDEVGPV